jgi:hypothetical protein
VSKTIKNVRNQKKVRELKAGQRNPDTYEDLMRCKSGGPHKQERGDRRNMDRYAIEESVDDD